MGTNSIPLSRLEANLRAMSQNYTEAADMEFDEHGKVIKKGAKEKTSPGNDLGL